MPTEKDRENNLQHARLTAYRCMLKYGVTHTDYELIAEKSGLGVRTLRRYFRNKVDLVCDVMKTIGGERYHILCEEIMSTIPPEACGLQQLRQLHYSMYDLFKNGRSPWLMFSELELFAYENRISGEILGQYLKEVQDSRKYARQMLIKGMQDGSIRCDIDPDTYTTLLANTYIGMLQRMEAVRYTETDYNLTSIEEQVNLYIESVTAILKNPSDTGRA